MNHLMDFGLCGEVCRHANQPVSLATMIVDHQISARGRHARHRRTELDVACLELGMTSGNGLAKGESCEENTAASAERKRLS